MSVVHTGYVMFFYTQDGRLFWVTDNGIITGTHVDDIPNEAHVFKEYPFAIGYWKENYSFIRYERVYIKAVSRYVVDEGWETPINTGFNEVHEKVGEGWEKLR
jgi:hypothetical protein